MPREATGSVEWVEPKAGEAQGHWCARITLKDGATPRVHLNPSVKSAYTKLRAKERAREISDEARAKGLTAKDFPSFKRPVSVPASADMTDWLDAWLKDRTGRGVGTKENKSHWQHHIQPIVGAKHVRDWTSADLRALVAYLDGKMAAGEMKWKMALNVWATCTAMCRDAMKSKVDALRVRPDNVARDVAPPERGAVTAKQYVYPSEALKFIACEKVPLTWRRNAAIAIYLFLRAGEHRALRWEDVDLEHGMVHVHRAENRETGKVEATKTEHARRFAFEPALLRNRCTTTRSSGAASPGASSRA
jgi:integrase